MGTDGKILLAIGVLILSLHGEHLLHSWQPSDELRVYNGSRLTRMILGNQYFGKEPSEERLRELDAQQRVGRTIIERWIPLAGLLLCLGGGALVLADRQRNSRVSCR